jgi:hypothetical protein
MSSLWVRDPLDDNALIVVFPDRRGGLWSGDISRLVEQVEEQLDAGFVSFALANGRRPSVADALAAARFAGCSSAVLAVVDGENGGGVGALPGPLQGMTVSVASCRRNAGSVVEAFRTAAGGARAACA